VLAGQPVSVTLSVAGTCTIRGGPLHIVFTIDAWLQPTGDRLDRVKATAQRIADQLGVTRGGYVRIGVVEYGAEARTACRLTDRADRLKDCIDGVGLPGGLVQMDAGIERAMLVLVQGRRDFEPPAPGREVIVLFGDRNQAGCEPVLLAANQAKGQEMLVASVCIAGSCNTECLQQVSTPGLYSHIDDTSALEADLLARRNTLMPARIDYVNVTDVLPAGLAIVPLSARPAARVAGQMLEWEVRTAAPVTRTTAVTLTFQATAAQAGTFPVSTGETAVKVAIGRDWFAPEVDFPVPLIEVRPQPTPIATESSGPEATLYLPRALKSAAAAASARSSHSVHSSPMAGEKAATRAPASAT
jgi:hypothetical protein